MCFKPVCGNPKKEFGLWHLAYIHSVFFFCLFVCLRMFEIPVCPQRNTFQAVLASDGSDTYALFLYPANGLQFFGTRPKESYNIQLQLPARVGFCRGEADDLKREVPYFSLTDTEQSVKNLYQ